MAGAVDAESIGRRFADANLSTEPTGGYRFALSPLPSGVNTSTAKEKVRASPGSSAPTPTTWRATSSPRSFRIDTTTEYSHASPAFGCRIDPSTRSGENEGMGAAAAPESNRRCFRQAGQTAALCRITVRQCGQVRVAPASARRTVLTRPDLAPTSVPTWRPATRAPRPNRTRRAHACATPRPP